LFASGAVETAFILAMGLHSLIASDPAFELNARRSHLAALKERLANERPDLAVLDLTPEITSAVLGDLQDLAPESKLKTDAVLRESPRHAPGARFLSDRGARRRVPATAAA
jgi:hypothetical protein